MLTTAFTLFVSAALLAGCGVGVSDAVGEAPTPGGSPETPQEVPSTMVPPGYGTLLQDQISLRLQSGRLLINVTPLDEGLIRLTAPDTYKRLKGLAEVHGPRATRTGRASESSLFLVSLFSYQPDVTYEPEDLQLVNRGLRLRPEGIAPITPSWGTQRLGQQEARMAVYAFSGGIEWESELVAEYQQLRNESWRDQVFPLVQAEKAKVRARAG
ncbi:MAG: hypothetical protein HKO65_11275, partial [Gemmatimonadetes bacterium]|nr:hypothetical protein [Gemmatimonadota bacterium]